MPAARNRACAAAVAADDGARLAGGGGRPVDRRRLAARRGGSPYDQPEKGRPNGEFTLLHGLWPRLECGGGGHPGIQHRRAAAVCHLQPRLLEPNRRRGERDHRHGHDERRGCRAVRSAATRSVRADDRSRRLTHLAARARSQGRNPPSGFPPRDGRALKASAARPQLPQRVFEPLRGRRGAQRRERGAGAVGYAFSLEPRIEASRRPQGSTPRRRREARRGDRGSGRGDLRVRVTVGAHDWDHC